MAGAKIPGGASVWGVGTDTAKLQVYSRLRIEEGPGAMHWYVGTTDEYFNQLCAEKLVTKYVKGYPRQE